MRKKELLKLDYNRLPNTILIQSSTGMEKCSVLGLTKEKVKVKLYDLLNNGYDLTRSCNKYGSIMIMTKNERIERSTMTIQTY